jgi:hypothetical protein
MLNNCKDKEQQFIKKKIIISIKNNNFKAFHTELYFWKFRIQFDIEIVVQNIR